MVGTPLVAWMNPLPIELAPALKARRRAVAATAGGRVLDLGGWTDHLSAYRLGDPGPAAADMSRSVSEVTLLVGPGDSLDAGRRDPKGIVRLNAGFGSLADLGVEPFDTIVSLIRTPLIADFDRLLDVVIQLLAPRGRLLMLEPVHRPGSLGKLIAFGGLFVRAGGGLHLDRDIPARLRDAGMTVTDLERFEVPTLSAPLRPFIQAEARPA